MPFIQRDGYRLSYTWDGNPAGPVLMLSHSLGAHSGMWGPQLFFLGRHFHLLRYDHPGHGASDPRPGLATIADFGSDALAILDTLGLERVYFCGLSLGGMVGLWLGAHAPDRLIKMALSSTAARIENPELLRGRIAVIRREGLAAIAESVVTKWFTPAFCEQHPERVQWAKELLLQTRPEAYASTAETVCNLDLRPEVEQIRIPALILYGENDLATPPAWTRAVQERLQGSTLCGLPAAHLANVEAADEFSDRVDGFLNDSGILGPRPSQNVLS
jgi:3-oxoadipate enol-lactonase